MLKLHDELIAELSNLLTAQNYNPVVVANNRLYARAFLDYLAECDLQVEAVTPVQVDQYFIYASQDFEVQYGRPPSPRWHMLPRSAIAKLTHWIPLYNYFKEPNILRKDKKILESS